MITNRQAQFTQEKVDSYLEAAKKLRAQGEELARMNRHSLSVDSFQKAVSLEVRAMNMYADLQRKKRNA